jgi:uncharacterized membrane protein YhaH (DUF805 family)
MNVFTFKGRTGRGNFWGMAVFLPLVLFSIKEWLIFQKYGFNPERFNNAAIFLMDGLITLFILWVQVAAVVRRLHDLGYSSWFQFAYIMPMMLGCIGFLGSKQFGMLTFLSGSVITILWMTIHCGFIAGDPKKNIYGDPVE